MLVQHNSCSLTFFKFFPHISLTEICDSLHNHLQSMLYCFKICDTLCHSLPMVRPGIVTAFPVTSCSDEYPNLLREVLCVQANTFTSASMNGVFLSSINIWIVISVEAWFLSLILLLQGEYAGQNFIVKKSLIVSFSCLILVNSPQLSAKYPTEGYPTL